MDAWGLTETTGVATTNSPRTGFRLGSVGRPVSSVQVRVAGDGEIEVRGSTVCSGYLREDGTVRSAHGIDKETGPAALAAHPVVREEVDRAVTAANTRLNRTEQVKRYRLLAEEWGPAAGELTPSLKMKRRVIRDKYALALGELYED